MHLVPTTLVAAAAALLALSSAFEPVIPAKRSYVHIDNVCQQYPVTLMDVSLCTVFSSLVDLMVLLSSNNSFCLTIA